MAAKGAREMNHLKNAQIVKEEIIQHLKTREIIPKD